jgi:hypothetical protein
MKKFTDKINESVEDKIPTAEEFLNNNSFKGHVAMDSVDEDDIITDMIEFAKLHVEAALKEIIKNMNKVRGEDDPFYNIDLRQILNAYPLDNIK